MKQELIQLNKRILDLQEKVNAQYNNDYLNEMYDYYTDKIYFSEHNDLYDIIWYGSTEDYEGGELWSEDNFDEGYLEYESVGFSWFINLIIKHHDKIKTLTFTGPNEGANGTRDWDFERLANTDVVFKNLTTFKVDLTNLGDHNTSIIGYVDASTKVPNTASKLLLKMPNLVNLELPSPPDVAFFKADFPKLKHIVMQSGYDHLNFIKNFAESTLCNQSHLDFTDCLFDVEDSEEAKQHHEFQDKKQANIQKFIAKGLTKKEALKEADRIILREAGYSEEEILLDMDTHNREETLRLVTIVANQDETLSLKEKQKDIKESMDYFDSIQKWDENGEPYPEDDDCDDFEEDKESPTLNKRTPFEDYEQLFNAMKKGGNAITIRESFLTKKQRFALQKMNDDTQFLHITTVLSNYVSHLMEE